MSIKRPLMLLALALPLAAIAQTKWDLPAGYAASNFHTENLVQFANDVDKATGGKLKITVHANASLFKAPEIKRAVQGGQAQIGEILLANFQNEWQIFGADGLPFLADSYDDAAKLYKAQKPMLEKKLGRAGHDAAVRGAVAAAGHLRQEADQQRSRPEGHQVARLQPGHRAHRRAGGRAAGHRAGGRAVAGHGHRRGRELHVLGRHRLRHQDLRARQVLVRHAGLAAQERGHRQQGRVRRARRADASRRCSRPAPTPKRAAGTLARRPRTSNTLEHAEEERHDDPAAHGATQGRHEEGRRHHAQGVAREGRPRRQGTGRRLTAPSKRARAQRCSTRCTTARPRWRRCS